MTTKTKERSHPARSQKVQQKIYKTLYFLADNTKRCKKDGEKIL